MAVVTVPGFGSGVVLEGGSDQQRSDELRRCDNGDIGARGAIVLSPGNAQYLAIKDPDGNYLQQLFLIRSVMAFDFVRELYVGQGFGAAVNCYVYGYPTRSGQASPYTAPAVSIFGGTAAGGGTPAPLPEGVCVTLAAFAGVHKIMTALGAQALANVYLVCIGAREGFAAGRAQGLYALYRDPAVASTFIVRAIDFFDSLGTGPRGQYGYDNGVVTGNKGKQLHFRGICAHNGYAFGWGHDQSDSAAGSFEGPTRVMFSNPGKPLVWGNDNQGATNVNRDFTDSDALVIGDLGEIVRAGISWNGKLWLGTNQRFHSVSGYGRDTWVTDGARPVPRAENVLGPHCLVHGPDNLLYGVGDQGLWAFDGASFERHHRKLRNFRDMSPEYWDCIWTDRTKADTYPGKTNQDLVWMATDWDTEEVVVGIPFTDGVSGPGNMTVIVKYNTRTKGFTRRTIPMFAEVVFGANYSQNITTADFARRQGQYPARKLLGMMSTSPTIPSNIMAYAEKPTPTTDMPRPENFPNSQGDDTTVPYFKVEIGDYAFAGSEGSVALRTVYLTISWSTPTSAFRFLVEHGVDQGYPIVHWHLLTINGSPPTSPINEGDYWLDYSGTDTNLGNLVAGVLVEARRGCLLKVRRNGAWVIVPGGAQGGQGAQRATIRMQFVAQKGTREFVRLTDQALYTSGRFQIESFGAKPGIITDGI